MKDLKNETFIKLRNEFSYFIFEDFDYSFKDNILVVKYNFNLAGKYRFTPKLTFDFPKEHILEYYDQDFLENMLFNVGMIELISYWKSACPRKIIVKSGALNEEQIDWWMNLYFKGLGEFFFMNNIWIEKNELVEIEPRSEKKYVPFKFPKLDKTLIPVGGGKDSVVTLELFQSSDFDTIPFMINPSPAGKRIIKIAGYNENNIIGLKRIIDPLLLELNGKGFLNGHTPFSAVVAFTGLISAYLTGSGYIALSNESSANEPTHPELGVNHQFSKTYEFESMFRQYVTKYLTDSIEYFSFLRPLNEYQIAFLFSKNPQYFYDFRSCNKGSKKDAWCCDCPKCLFTYIILSPFVRKEVLVKIFGIDLLDKASMQPLLDQLTGYNDIKPFECVGTHADVNTSLLLLAKQLSPQQLPVLLKHYLKSDLDMKQESDLMNDFDSSHFVPAKLEQLLKINLYG
ncbi:MAG: hypothetical protein K8R53_13485 [Bacteroidales bacterium]|nr:hypothetical protein [Bacteroidales bacterium]